MMIIDTAYKIKVMQSYLDGKTIYFTTDKGLDVYFNVADDTEPLWDWIGNDYKVWEDK